MCDASSSTAGARPAFRLVAWLAALGGRVVAAFGSDWAGGGSGAQRAWRRPPGPGRADASSSASRPTPVPSLPALPEPTRRGKPRGGGADAASRPRHLRASRRPARAVLPGYGRHWSHYTPPRVERPRGARARTAQQRASSFARRPSRHPPCRAWKPGPARAAAPANNLGAGRARQIQQRER